MIRIYIAAPWTEKDGKAKEAQTYFEEKGFKVMSSWIGRDVEDFDFESDLEREREAENDLRDLYDSDMLVLINSKLSEGKMFEMAIAYAAGMPIIVVGERTHVFHCLSEIEVVDSLKRAAEILHVRAIEWKRRDEGR